MGVNWQNTYEKREGQWFKGSLHSHSSPNSPCSHMTLQDLQAAYLKKGYDFLSVSDHMTITEAESQDLAMIPGMEWNTRTRYLPVRSITYETHMGFYSLDHAVMEKFQAQATWQTAFKAVSDDDPLIVLNHPNWTQDGHYDIALLLVLAEQASGLEIFNHVTQFGEGQADATPQWDRLLSHRKPILGFASDDSHREESVGHAWLMVRAPQKTPASIFASIKQGNFYCSTGVVLKDIFRREQTVGIELEQEARISFYGDAGKLLHRVVASEASFSFEQADTSYIRVEVHDRNWAQAWSQPFFA